MEQAPRIPREHRVGIVVATRDRAPDLDATLAHLTALAERPRVVVVDNASTDDTVAVVRHAHPGVELIPLPGNLAAAARTIGARHLDTDYVAFSDDDSWWAPGSLAKAADILDAHPRLGLLAARVLVGEPSRLDPTCAAMAETPLPQKADLGAPAILGFIACGAIVRRRAFLDVGGFEARFGVGGEEELLALDLATAGWGLHYVDEIVAHHHPSRARDPSERQRRELRNRLWSAWLRYPLPSLVARSAKILAPTARPAAVAGALAEALRGLPWILRERRPVPPEVARSLALLGESYPSKAS